jgi:hypothetical protein
MVNSLAGELCQRRVRVKLSGLAMSETLKRIKDRACLLTVVCNGLSKQTCVSCVQIEVRLGHYNFEVKLHLTMISLGWEERLTERVHVAAAARPDRAN